MEGDGGLHSVVVLTEWISIHALRVEGDRHPLTRFRDRWHFYPRPPGGGRPRGNFHGLYIEIFLSTPSGWRATRAFHTVTRRSDYFYPRPPGGGRPLQAAPDRRRRDFYPRPPGGGRLGFHRDVRKAVEFLSTPSGWRATAYGFVRRGRVLNFYPRPPGGGRPSRCRFARNAAFISIHALRVEGDSKNGQSFHLFLRKREKKLPL